MSCPRARHLASLLLLAAACSSEPAPSDTGAGADAGASSSADAAPGNDASSSLADAATQPTPSVTLPPENGAFDYQLGGGYPPPAGVVIVSRDRTDSPAQGLYNICYVNGFQVQPGEESLWADDLVLRDESGEPVIDADWDEALLDPSTDDKRTRIAEVLFGFIDGCADAGFDAVEIDNLDSYTRSGGRLGEDHAVALMALLSAHAHAAGLAIAQKNSAELVVRRSELGTDFAVAEECSHYDECSAYVGAYGAAVLMIEYDDPSFAKGCSDFGATHAIVRRDLDLVTPGDGAYVFDGC